MATSIVCSYVKVAPNALWETALLETALWVPFFLWRDAQDIGFQVDDYLLFPSTFNLANTSVMLWTG